MKFTDTTHCQSGHNCMTCRHSQGMRDNWKRRYEVPDDFDERCAVGKTLEQIKKEHPEKMKEQKEEKLSLDVAQAHALKILEAQQTPTLPRKAVNFLLSMKDVALGLAAGRTPVVPDEVLEERVKTCEANECKKYGKETQTCLQCGCSFKGKLPLAEMECPLGFWSKYRKKL